MKFLVTPGARSRRGYSLIEMLVYIGVVAVLTSVGLSAMYHSMTSSTAIRRNVDDIVAAIHAGERWRTDIRAAGPGLRLTENAGEQVLNLSGNSEVAYRFADHTISRRIGQNDWTIVLANVAESRFVSESRGGVPVWRWELELEARSKRLTRTHPLFTFIAVPARTALP